MKAANRRRALVRTRPIGFGDDIVIVEIARLDLSGAQCDQVFLLLKSLNTDGDDPGTGPGVFVDFVPRKNVDRVTKLALSIALRPIVAY